MKEIWKDIEGYEGYYQVSNFGNVRTPFKLLSKSIMVEYYSVHLRKYLDKTPKIHRLVAQAFIPNPLNLPQVNHKDCNKLNNHVDNLEWCTGKENIKHAINNGLTKRIGIDNCKAKLTEEQVLEIRRLYNEDNYSIKQLATLYNLNYSTAQRIIRRIYWKHI